MAKDIVSRKFLARGKVGFVTKSKGLNSGPD
jgi:hypothetical protein